MPIGKAASQAGHAYLESFVAADAARQAAYRADGLGTKICLTTPDLRKLLDLHAKVVARGLPCALIEDTGRNTTFGGVPTVSALGVGPLSAAEAKILRRLPLCP